MTNSAICCPKGAKMETRSADGRELRRWIARNLHKKTLQELQAEAGQRFGTVPNAQMVYEASLTLRRKQS